MAKNIKEMIDIEELKWRVEHGSISSNDIIYLSQWLYNLDERVSKLEEEREMKFLKRRKK